MRMSKHNASLPTNTDNDLIAEQGVQTLNINPLIVVEGGNDTLFIRCMLSEINYSFKLESKGGWKNVYRFVDTWNKSPIISEDRKKYNQVIGIIDRDYHDVLNEISFPDNIIKTDLRDLEVILFESDTALKKIFAKYGKETFNYPRKEKNQLDLDAIRNLIYQKSLALGRIRYHKVLNKFDDFSINCVTDNGQGLDGFFKDFNLDEDKLINLLNQRNRSVEKSIIASWIKDEVSLAPNLLCRGHDIILILVRAFRKHFNQLNTQQVSLDKIEQDLLLAFPFTDFKNLSYAKELFKKLNITLPS